jgi:hypothetical protein
MVQPLAEQRPVQDQGRLKSTFLCSPAHRSCRCVSTLLIIEGHPALVEKQEPTMTTKSTLISRALAAAAFAATALVANGSASANSLSHGFGGSGPVVVSNAGNGVGNTIGRLPSLPKNGAAGLKLAPVVRYTAHGAPKPPPGCTPRADCVKGNHGSPPRSAGGGYDVNENPNGPNPGGFDVDLLQPAVTENAIVPT